MRSVSEPLALSVELQIAGRGALTIHHIFACCDHLGLLSRWMTRVDYDKQSLNASCD